MVINAARLKHNEYDKATEDVRGSFIPMYVLSQNVLVMESLIKNIPALKKNQ